MLFRYLLFFALVLLLPFSAAAWEGKVVKIIDGDTIKVLKDHIRVKVRLAEINAPEEGRPWYRQSKNALKAQIAGKIVRVEPVENDYFDRLVGVVWLNNLNINEWMVQNGYAWVRRRYMRNPVLLELEEQARKQRTGLWSLPEHELLDTLLW